MQKKILSVLLAALMLCLFAFAVSADDLVISDAEGLLALMNAEDEATLGANYKLTADIDMTDVNDQNPIGSREVPFTGVFDGDGHTIKGLDITSFLTETGLFGGTKGATIQNLTVEGSVVGTNNNVAGIVGRAVLPLTVTNCVNKASILMMDSSSKVGVGGIIGSLVTEEADVFYEIKDCVNYGTVQSFSGGSGYCAGIVGYILSNAQPNITGTISNCVNYGKVDSFAASVAGGIMGYARYQGAETVGIFTIENCANFGEIHGRCYNGGILGAFGNENGVNNMTFVMNNVYNAGYVFGMSDDTSHSGSIIGLIRIPVLVDGVAPIHVTNAMDVTNDALSIIGNLGALEGSTVNFSGLYTNKGTSIIHYDPTTNGGTFVQQSMVTISSCAVSGSDANALTALVASDTSAWSMVDGAPMLTYFTDLAAGAPAILESLAPAETTAPETTVAPETTAAPDETKAPEETEAVGGDDEKDEKPEETTKKPASQSGSEGKGSDEGPNVGLFIGIGIGVLVVAAVVVVIILKKKKK